MRRRRFLQASLLGAALAGTGAAGSGLTGIGVPRADALPVGVDEYLRLVPELFVPPPAPPEHSEVVVVGSGFGASVAALRLAEAGGRVTMLERGMRWPRDPHREIFTTDLLADGRGYHHRTRFTGPTGIPVVCDDFAGVLDVVDYPNMSVWRGAAVGGGSIVFTGVMIAPERHFFEHVFGGRLSYDEMASTWYPKVRSMLRLDPMPDDIYNAAEFTHSRRWDDDARAAGYSPHRIDGIWDWDVVRAELAGSVRRSAVAGESNLGNSNGAKFDLTQNYIPAAEATGRTLVCHGHRVLAVGQDGDGRYWLDVQAVDPTGAVLRTTTITCDRLVLGAGSIGTTELLVKARHTGSLPNLDERVGRGWGTNGDAVLVRSFALTEGFGGDQGAPSASRIVDESGLPLSLENWFVAGTAKDVGMLASLGMTLDPTRADFTYDPGADRAVPNWPAGGERESVEALRAVHNAMAQAGGTIPGASPMAEDVNATFTAHPLGGAVLGDATDGYGRVHGHPGLYVVDGALIPGSTGTANPSLTIAALAERNIARIVADGR
ncbi:cholesterol oxidase [Rhodococcus rhodochrous J3]|uniref:Cholesterol oxidase n=1 Tax=Rhodococcus rhodochrous J3 TaxID=903528 RepID=A0ABY1MED6_RHORH|nr:MULTISPECIES: GMC oxidoreductase [Rhodococcus]AYA25086.1 GMC family oxidoreductase [Rhodococcus rhodochrous]MBF4477739.1 GMC family oxidoreductase [Rhodococcus rhodochrous]MCB8910828.1 GMC family oxidoreductase [Rhodococcus rhodochrous]MDC3725741.1 GMC family oxidoreductase [Rhodococcus sp. Rp3]MDJ0399410.1 GMC oxidoreductase [Rhodococcus rhodochrous]